jgi:RNA polymerase sigma factor (sigma-70 family)
MATDQPTYLLQHLRLVAAATRADNASDRELVDCFVADRDDTAFAVLFRRHGPMVHSLCRRVLGNEQEADDAFQATFLVLARKAHSLRAQDTISSWLYGVAYRTALKARSSAVRRRAHEAAAPVRTTREPLTELTIAEAQSVVDQELAGLPEKFRSPLVLCCLEGLTRDEAARQLGWTLSVLKSRLEQARELLRRRLARRGLTLPAALLSLGLLGSIAQTAVPAALAAATVKAATLVAVGGSAAAVVSSNVIVLAEGVIRAMWFAKLKVPLAATLALIVLGIGVTGAVYLQAGASPQTPVAESPKAAVPVAQPAVVPEGEKTEAPALPKPESLARWGQAEIVFTAHLSRAAGGPVGLSEPPLYSTTLQLKVIKVLRGSLKPGEVVTAVHSVRQKDRPVFPEGRDVVVAMNTSRGQKTAQAVVELTADEKEQAELACSVPPGWTIQQGRLLSPWAKLGAKAWPAEAKGKGPLVCAETGRPCLLVGDGVELTAEPLPPTVKLQFGNPDGDGEYRITLKNTTDKPVTIPALLSDGTNILWDESMVILCQNKVYTVPGAKGVAKPVQPTVLKPGESISGVVNALKLQGPEWPRGGYRIDFQFCLGEKSVTKSFYYTSKHHDPLRAKLEAEK